MQCRVFHARMPVWRFTKDNLLPEAEMFEIEFVVIGEFVDIGTNYSSAGTIVELEALYPQKEEKCVSSDSPYPSEAVSQSRSS